jgi:protein TonB
MKEQRTKAPGFDEIIFENRNKDYGAYNLRRRYHRTLLLALLIGMVLLSAAVIGPYVRAKGATMTKTEDKEEEVFVRMERLDQPDEEVIKVYAPPPPPQEMVVQTVKYVAPEVVDTVLPEEVGDQLMTMDESVQNVQDEGVAAHIEYVTGDQQEEVVPEEEQVFFIVEEMPSFQGGGEDAFREWIAKNLRYPEIAADNGISGRVYVQFAVNSKGEVCDAVVVRGVDPALDKEALRVVLSSPRWEPGRQRGRPVKVQFTFPINFILQ